MKSNKTTFAFVAICLLAVVTLIVVYVTNSTKDFNQPTKRFSELGGDFTLESHQGDVALSQYKGKVVVIYFGYTSCEMVCPNSLNVMAKAFSGLEEQNLLNTQGVLVTLDPERDTAEGLKEYTANFHKSIIGLTGSTEDIKSVGNQYGVYFDDDTKAAMEYSVDHASSFFVIDKQGNLVTAMSPTTTPNELAAQIKALI